MVDDSESSSASFTSRPLEHTQAMSMEPRLIKLPKHLQRSVLFKAVMPLLKKGWAVAFRTAEGSEQKAFIQLASLPVGNTAVDREWVDSIHRSNQRNFKVLMSIFLHVAGVSGLDGHCNACQMRGPLKRRNCRVLPPEAKGLRELQDVVGRQCVNCYFYPTSRPCDFHAPAAAGAGAQAAAAGAVGAQTAAMHFQVVLKQTPVPVPQRAQQAHLAQAQAQARPSSRPVPVATGSSRPISQTPIPVPPVPAVKSLPSLSSGPSSVVASSRPLGRASSASTDRQSSSASCHDQSARANSLELGTSSPTSRPGTRANNSASATAAAPSFGPSSASRPPNAAGSLATSAPRQTSTPPFTSSSLIAKAFTLFGEIGQLPAREQAGVCQKIAELSEIARRPLDNQGLAVPFPPSVPAAEDWEVAPGCLSARPSADAAAAAARADPVGFSSSFLRREVIGCEVATQVSLVQRVLNKHLPPLGVTRIGWAGHRWECTLTVLEGFVRVKMEGLEAKMAQGGVLVVGPASDCIVTNVMHQESKIQVRWAREG